MGRHKVLRLTVTATALAVGVWGTVLSGAAQKLKGTDTGKRSDRQITVVDAAGRKHTRMKPITLQERQAAAARLQAKRDAVVARAKAARDAAIGTPQEAQAQAAYLVALAAVGPLGSLEYLVGANGELFPDYSGFTPNYANSPMPTVNPDGSLTGGIRKFVDTLPGLDAPNNLGQMIPIAVPDRTSYPGADYYVIELVEYTKQMHSDLPPTTLRGYRQVNTPSGVAADPQYLGPAIVARKGVPVRITFRNSLPAGGGGNLFLPVDASVMGAGPGPNYTGAEPPDVACQKRPGMPVPQGCYTENRATIHLHGGVTPWISDGTPFQWITPATDTTEYPAGVSVYNVPDMANPGKPGTTNTGEQTFYYTNDQSARLMFYHDHAHGTTRLNVYAGMAAAYLLQDETELQLTANGIIPQDQIPLVIQDKTFVDATTIRTQDPTWSWGTGATYPYTDPTGRVTTLREPKTGDLWWPHVYQPAQNPYDISGLNAMGRWHYGPWFWPPTTGIPYLPVSNPYYDCNADGMADATHPCERPWHPIEVPGTPNPSWGAEAFLDTPVINGTAYPTLTVEPKAYRLRILNAAHDRFWNLQLYRADPNVTVGTAGLTEVRMTEANPGNPLLSAFPTWPRDGRDGGVPDPAFLGPNFLQIGTEGGFLPMPTWVNNQPIAWNLDPTTFNFGNVSDHALLLGPAERADVIVDFSGYSGQTLILYNDAPAAFPALDARNDYYTGAPDLTDVGGVAGVHPGYGPNIRTIMQIKVAGAVTTPSNYQGDAALMAEWAPVVEPNPDPTLPPIVTTPGVFMRSQDPIIVGQTAYNETYGRTFPAYYPNWGYARIQDFSMRFQSPDGNYARIDFKTKAIQDEMGEAFDDYGRMSAKLGLEQPNTAAGMQRFVLQGFNDPPTELVKLSQMGTLIGVGEDGTQIWKITHNGVDTHPVHFHLFHVQLINRVGWDGAIRLPDANELGWKDTVRISPLEDTIVALRPIAPRPELLPWPVPNSIRPLNPALPLGSTLGFTNIDPQGNPVAITNDLANFGWEYVWHCHILSHEENDMMRAVAFAAPPAAPTLTVGPATNLVELQWVDNSVTASGFTIQRASDQAFTQNVVTIQVGLVNRYDDHVNPLNGPFYYRIRAVNTVGSTVVGYPTITAVSEWSNWVGPAQGATALAVTQDIASRSPVVLSWNYIGADAASVIGWVIQRSTTSTFTSPTQWVIGQEVEYFDTSTRAGTLYYYRVAPLTVLGRGPWSNTVSITPHR